MDVPALEALTALATADSVTDALDALRSAREALAEHAESFEPLLSCLTARASEVLRLRRMAGRDPLTGVANRRAFEDALHREIARHERSGAGLAVVLVDLDDLKGINDEFGHPFGDRAILALAQACQATVRTSDLVARLGGDEFAVLLPGVDVAGAVAAAERIRDAICERVVAGRRLRASLGVAAAVSPTVVAPELMAEADAALYADKRGRKSTRVAA